MADTKTTYPSLPDISIRQLEYLVAVADSPTWAAAAEKVGVSASALSQGLAELERRLGLALFEPVGRRRQLRPIAAPVLDHARQVTALTSDLSTWSSRLRDGQSGAVRLGIVDVGAVVHFPETLRSFRSKHPDVELTLSVSSSSTLMIELQGGRLDLVVCVEPPAPVSGIDTVPLLSEPLVVYGPADTEIGDPVDWGPWILFPEDSHTRQLVVKRLRSLGAPIEVAAESHQPEVVREMVLLGLGWTVLPRSQGEVEPVDVSIGNEILERSLVLARRTGSVQDPAVDELAERFLSQRV